MKIGELERTHQIFRQHLDHHHGYPAGPDQWYWCTRCGDALPSLPLEEVRGCECGNLFFDVGRFCVQDHDELVLLATAARSDTA